MTETEWNKTLRVEPMLVVLRGRGPNQRLRGVVSHRKLRLFAVGVWLQHYGTSDDPFHRRVVSLTETVADSGMKTDQIRRLYQEFMNEVQAADRVGTRRGQAFVEMLRTDPLRAATGIASALRIDWTITGDTEDWVQKLKDRREAESTAQAELLRCVTGNPFRPVRLLPVWRTSTAVALARQMYDARDFAALPILADALQDAECEDEHVLGHCRGGGPHARGCWVVDGVLGLG